MKRVKHTNYEARLLESLKDPEEALAYLNAALMDEDQKVFLLALKHVLNAQIIDIFAFAEDTDISRQNIYRMLSEKGNHRWNNLRSLVDAMGWQVRLEIKE